MRTSGPLTQRDRDTMRAMRAALQVAAAAVEPVLHDLAAAGIAFTRTQVQIGRAAALVAAFAAQPRHRELPYRDDVIEWLGRHCGEPEPEVRIVDDPAAEQSTPAFREQATRWYEGELRRLYQGEWLDRPGAGGRYSHWQAGGDQWSAPVSG